jgi:hypothetical protein
MIRNFLFCGAVFMALTGPAMAQEQCAAPAAPTIPDGARATPAQIGAAQNDIKAYAAASDSFQACIAREIERQKALAKDRNTEIDPAVQAALETKGTAQRKDVERLASAWGASVQAFNAAQQRKQRQNAPSAPGASPGAMTGGYRY